MPETVVQLQTPPRLRRRVEDILGLPRRDGPWSEIATFSPEQSREVLAAQPEQRRKSQAHIADLAADMAGDAWDLTNEGVGFDEDGLLRDGQHRFEGSVSSGKALRTLVLFNMHHAAFRSVNRGKRRTSADDLLAIGLAIANPSTAVVIAAAARVVLAHEKGLLPNLSDGRLRMKADDLAGVLKRHPAIEDSARLALTGRNRALRMPAAPFAGLLTLLREVDEDAAVAFATQIIDPQHIGRGDPAYALRIAQENDRSTQNAARTNFMFRFVRAWEALRQGRRIEQVKGKVAGGKFPAIHGYGTAVKRMAG